MSASQHHALNELKHSRTNSILIEWHRLRILCFFTVQTRSFEVFLNFQTLLCRWLEIYLQAMTWCDFLTPTQRGCTESPWQTVESSCTCDPENLHPPVQVYLPEQPPLRCIHWCWETDSHGKIIFYISVDTMSMFKLNKTCNVLNTGSNSRLYDVMIINMELHQQMEHYRKRMWNARLRTRGRSFIDC